MVQYQGISSPIFRLFKTNFSDQSSAQNAYFPHLQSTRLELIFRDKISWQKQDSSTVKIIEPPTLSGYPFAFFYYFRKT